MLRPPFETVTDLQCGADILRARHFGIIEVAAERLQQIRLRPWPKVSSLLDVVWLGRRRHESRPGNCCWLYYNQPLLHPRYLALRYVVSNRDTTLRTFRGALLILDEIARLKGSDAIVCEASNSRISDRLLSRWGWERHLEDRPRRHWIKRFYGQYPPPDEALPALLA